MKLQISGQQWRLRVSEDELQQLRNGHALISTTLLPGEMAFRFQLELTAAAQASIWREADTWKCSVPAALVDAYVLRLPCREGLDFVLPVTAEVALELAFEVDVRDSARRRGAGIHRR